MHASFGCAHRIIDVELQHAKHVFNRRPIHKLKETLSPGRFVFSMANQYFASKSKQYLTN